MKLQSMKMSPEEKKDLKEPTLAGGAPAYPYGLQLHLDDEALKKLGLKGLPEAGEKMMLHAKVEIVSVSQSDSAQGGKHRSCSLQITDAALAPMIEGSKKDVEIFYGK